MGTVRAKGGPMDNQRLEFEGSELKVPLGYEYGWRHKCGHESPAFGRYSYWGLWREPERDVTLESDCGICSWWGYDFGEELDHV